MPAPVGGDIEPAGATMPEPEPESEQAEESASPPQAAEPEEADKQLEDLAPEDAEAAGIQGGIRRAGHRHPGKRL